MKLVTFEQHGSSEPGVLLDSSVLGLRAAGFASTLDVIALWADARARIEEWIKERPVAQVFPLASVKLLAPIPRPPKIICVGLNYRDHALRKQRGDPESSDDFFEVRDGGDRAGARRDPAAAGF